MTKFGCLRDRFDERDYLMRAYLPVVKLPKKVDYAPGMSPVRDQGDEGTCVGFAMASGMKEYQEMLDYKKQVILSPRFLYSECKKIDGMPEEEGTTIRTAMKVLKKKGVCLEKFWPYIPHQKNKPKKEAFHDAEKFRIFTYARILNLDELRLSLATKGPAVIGVEVFSRFAGSRWIKACGTGKGMMKTKNGIVPLPKKNESALGGHAICAAGYDDKNKLIKFKNSWSKRWGRAGYGFLPYAYIESYMMDAWSSVDIDDPNPLTLATIFRYRDRALA